MAIGLAKKLGIVSGTTLDDGSISYRLQPLQVSGHDFSRADRSNKHRALAPAVTLSNLVLVFGMVAVLICPTTLVGQGCATCYTTAAAAKDVAIRALRHGILILAVPPVILFSAVVGLALRRREDTTGKPD